MSWDNTPPGAITLTGNSEGTTMTAARVATTASVTLATFQPGAVVDGVTLAENDRVLVWQQSTASQNGIYRVNASVAASRVTDADASGEFTAGMLVPITAGTLYAGKMFRLLTSSPTLGSTSIVYVQDPAPATVAGVTFDNTAPGAATISGNTPSNTPPSAATVAGVTFDNTAPGAGTLTGNTMSNTPPGQVVIEGEQSPVGGVTPPTPPNVVEHTETLVAGTHYTVQVGTRSAAVVIDLPDPGSSGQRIEIVDTSGQVTTYGITVDGGTKHIITPGAGLTYALPTNYAVLAIYYTGSYWKII